MLFYNKWPWKHPIQKIRILEIEFGFSFQIIFKCSFYNIWVFFVEKTAKKRTEKVARASYLESLGLAGMIH